MLILQRNKKVQSSGLINVVYSLHFKDRGRSVQSTPSRLIGKSGNVGTLQ